MEPPEDTDMPELFDCEMGSVFCCIGLYLAYLSICQPGGLESGEVLDHKSIPYWAR